MMRDEKSNKTAQVEGYLIKKGVVIHVIYGTRPKEEEVGGRIDGRPRDCLPTTTAT